MFNLTSVYPCTDENRVSYELALKVALDSKRAKSAPGTVKHVTEWAKAKLRDFYEVSECQRLGKVDPESPEYYQALMHVTHWTELGTIEAYWRWFDKERFSPWSILFFFINPIAAPMLNYVYKTDANFSEWKEAAQIIVATDLPRLAGHHVLVELPDRTVKLPYFR